MKRIVVVRQGGSPQFTATQAVGRTVKQKSSTAPVIRGAPDRPVLTRKPRPPKVNAVTTSREKPTPRTSPSAAVLSIVRPPQSHHNPFGSRWLREVVTEGERGQGLAVVWRTGPDPDHEGTFTVPRGAEPSPEGSRPLEDF